MVKNMGIFKNTNISFETKNGDTVIGNEAYFQGTLTAKGSLRIDGRIDGSALGWRITGRWTWKDGYFCREMDWSGMAIDFNCQLVEAAGVDRMRFTVDQGRGDSATFRLR